MFLENPNDCIKTACFLHLLLFWSTENYWYRTTQTHYCWNTQYHLYRNTQKCKYKYTIPSIRKYTKMYLKNPNDGRSTVCFLLWNELPGRRRRCCHQKADAVSLQITIIISSSSSSSSSSSLYGHWHHHNIIIIFTIAITIFTGGAVAIIEWSIPSKSNHSIPQYFDKLCFQIYVCNHYYRT